MSIYVVKQILIIFLSITKNGLYIGAVTLLIIVTLLITKLFKSKNKKSRILIEKRQEEADYEQTILQTQLEIQEQTLKNISQEIHENIGQVLSLVKLNINTMNCDEPQILQEKIDDSKVMITKAIKDLRALSNSLDTDYVIKKGLINSIEYELELIKKGAGFKTQFIVEGQVYRIDSNRELILFRIVQEIFQNIIKHAKAKLIQVYAQFTPGEFLLRITANGVGFNPGNMVKTNDESTGGAGDMFTRAKIINSTIIFDSLPGNGTTIQLTLPLTTEINHMYVS